MFTLQISKQKYAGKRNGMEWNTIETKVLCFRCDIEHMSLKASTTFIAFMFSVLSNMLVSSACAYAYVMCIVHCVSVKRSRPIDLHLIHVVDMELVSKKWKTVAVNINSDTENANFLQWSR